MTCKQNEVIFNQYYYSSQVREYKYLLLFYQLLPILTDNWPQTEFNDHPSLSTYMNIKS